MDIPQFHGFTNHDCFGINAIFAYFLRYIVLNLYNQFAITKHMNLLLCSDTKEEIEKISHLQILKCTNLKNFIKH